MGWCPRCSSRLRASVASTHSDHPDYRTLRSRITVHFNQLIRMGRFPVEDSRNVLDQDSSPCDRTVPKVNWAAGIHSYASCAWGKVLDGMRAKTEPQNNSQSPGRHRLYSVGRHNTSRVQQTHPGSEVEFAGYSGRTIFCECRQSGANPLRSRVLRQSQDNYFPSSRIVDSQPHVRRISLHPRMPSHQNLKAVASSRI